MALSRGNSVYIEGIAGVAAASLDCGSDTNRMLMVGIWKGNAVAITSVIYGVQSCTLLGEQTLSGSSETLYVYGLKNPASGSNTLAVVYTAGPSVQVRATNYAGVAGALPSGDAIKINTATSVTSLTVNPVSVGDNSWGFCQARSLAGNIQDGTNMTLIAALSHDAIASLDSNGNLGTAGTETLQIGAASSGTMGMVACVFAESAPVTTLSLSENLSAAIIERFSRVWTAPRSQSDAVILQGESTTRAWSLTRGLPIDNISITEAISSVKSRVIEILETIGIVESFSRSVQYVRTLSEAPMTIIEAVTRVFVRTISLVESVIITEVVSISKVLSVVISNFVGIIEYVRTPLNWLKRTRPTTTWTPRTKP